MKKYYTGLTQNMRYFVENMLEMLTYFSICSAFSHVFASYRIILRKSCFRWIILWSVVSSCFAVTPYNGAGEIQIQAGKDKATTCAACHGQKGISNSPIWPNLAGQNIKYLIKQLMDFKKGKQGGRFNETMTPLVANLTEKDMQDLAVYYASLPLNRGSTKQEYLSLGQTIYRGGIPKQGIPACSACHSPVGLGNKEAGFPVVSGQQSEYIVAQLLAYRDGKRSNGVADIMSDISKKLTEREMQAVASYMSGLHE